MDPLALELRDERGIVERARDLQRGLEQGVRPFRIEACRRRPVDRCLARERIGTQPIVAALGGDALERLVGRDRLVLGATQLQRASARVWKETGLVSVMP